MMAKGFSMSIKCDDYLNAKNNILTACNKQIWAMKVINAAT